MSEYERLILKQIVDRVITDFFIDGDGTPVITLDDGTAIAIMRDEEGNGPGAIWVEGGGE